MKNILFIFVLFFLCMAAMKTAAQEVGVESQTTPVTTTVADTNYPGTITQTPEIKQDSVTVPVQEAVTEVPPQETQVSENPLQPGKLTSIARGFDGTVLCDYMFWRSSTFSIKGEYFEIPRVCIPEADWKTDEKHEMKLKWYKERVAWIYRPQGKEKRGYDKDTRYELTLEIALNNFLCDWLVKKGKLDKTSPDVLWWKKGDVESGNFNILPTYIKVSELKDVSEEELKEYLLKQTAGTEEYEGNTTNEEDED